MVVENGLHPVDLGRPNKYPMPVWYHKPSDEYRNDWDLSGTLSNVNLIFSVGLSLSNAEELLDREWDSDPVDTVETKKGEHLAMLPFLIMVSKD